MAAKKKVWCDSCGDAEAVTWGRCAECDAMWHKCWDCGSTIKGRHTATCEMAEEGAAMDLPAQPGTQWWTGELPATEVK